MSRARRAATAVAGLLLALTVLNACAGAPAATKATTALPDLSLPAFATGADLDLGQLRGPTVINLWSSTCGPCRREMPVYQAFSQRFGAQVPVIGIDYEDHTSGLAADLVRRTGVTYPLYTDLRGDLAGNAGMPVPRALPMLVLVDARGHIAHLEYVEIKSVGQLSDLVATHLGVHL